MEKNVRIEERLTKAFLKVAILTLIGAAVILIALGVTSNRYTFMVLHKEISAMQCYILRMPAVQPKVQLVI